MIRKNSMIIRTTTLFVFVLFFILGCARSQVLSVPVREIDGLSDERAIALTRMAIAEAGINPDFYTPVHFSPVSSCGFSPEMIWILKRVIFSGATRKTHWDEPGIFWCQSVERAQKPSLA
jgi:hypothetical protein